MKTATEERTITSSGHSLHSYVTWFSLSLSLDDGSWFLFSNDQFNEESLHQAVQRDLHVCRSERQVDRILSLKWTFLQLMINERTRLVGSLEQGSNASNISKESFTSTSWCISTIQVDFNDEKLSVVFVMIPKNICCRWSRRWGEFDWLDRNYPMADDVSLCFPRNSSWEIVSASFIYWLLNLFRYQRRASQAALPNEQTFSLILFPLLEQRRALPSFDS